MDLNRPIKVNDIKTFLIRPFTSNKNWVIQKHWLLIKVETDQGIVGWGEAFTMKHRERIIAQHVAGVTPYLIGRNPFHIKPFTQMVWKHYSERRGSVELYSALSGIEQALWDILGKFLGVPVYNLLGGPCRDTIRVYANGFSRGAGTPEEMAERAVEAVHLGFTAIKIYPFINTEDDRTAMNYVRSVREAVGPEIDILIDIWRHLSPTQAIRIAKRLEEYNIFWYEEPIPSDHLDVLAEVRRSIRIPVVTGECIYTKSGFREVLEKRAADILNPDVASCGGILEFKEISAMAEPYHISIAPHNWNSTTMALAATIQVAAVIPNFLIAEYFVSFAETGNAIALNPFKIEHGSIRLPTKPGLGLEIDEAVLKDYPYQEYPLEDW